MIKITDYNKQAQKLSFVTDMDLSLANAVRRSVLEIPIIAIDEVEIIKNDSALYDEIIAHRIGLIPIKNEKSMKEIKFRIVEKGPKIVDSTDLKPGTGQNIKIPIVFLDKEQEIEVICDARIGKGIDHIKYSPGLIYYRHNLDNDILDYVQIDENGKISYDEKELESKIGEAQINKIKKIKECNEILFFIESWGQLEVRDIFPEAIDALVDNLKELDKLVK